MCLLIYLASAEPLPLLAWDKEAPVFHVIDLPERERIVRNHLAEAYIYYAGSYEKCGCAFNYGREYPEYEDDPEELKRAEESVAHLAKYLTAVIPKDGSLRLFSCWAGDESKPPELFREIRPNDIREKEFVFRRPELLTIRAGA